MYRTAAHNHRTARNGYRRTYPGTWHTTATADARGCNRAAHAVYVNTDAHTAPTRRGCVHGGTTMGTTDADARCVVGAAPIHTNPMGYCIMSTNVIDPASAAWGHYVAVRVNGMRPSERAAETGVTPSTVSAAVKRIEQNIAAGWAHPPIDGTTVATDTPSVSVVPASMHDAATDAFPRFGAMFMADRDNVVTNADRATDAANRAIAARDAAIAARDAWADDAATMGFDVAAVYDAFTRINGERGFVVDTDDTGVPYVVTDDDGNPIMRDTDDDDASTDDGDASTDDGDAS